MTIFEDFSTVEFLALFFEVIFYHIDVLFVCLMINSGVLHDQNTKFVQRSCNFCTFSFPDAFPLFKVSLHVNNWWFDERDQKLVNFSTSLCCDVISLHMVYFENNTPNY